MAKVVITIEDTVPGRYSAKVTPSMETLVKMHQDGVALSPAQESAVIAVQAIWRSTEEGAENRAKKKIINPYGR